MLAAAVAPSPGFQRGHASSGRGAMGHPHQPNMGEKPPEVWLNQGTERGDSGESWGTSTGLRINPTGRFQDAPPQPQAGRIGGIVMPNR